MTAPSAPSRSQTHYLVHELPWADRHRLAEAGGPLGAVDLDQLTPCRLVVIEDATTGRLTGYWPIFAAVHVEPVWIAPDVRGNPSVARQLLVQVLELLQESGVSFAFVTVDERDQAVSEIVTRLGMERIPATLHALHVPPVEASEGDQR